MHRPACRLTLLLFLFLSPSLCHAVDGPLIFGPHARWQDPARVKAGEADLMFRDRFTGDYQNLGYNTMGRLDDGSVFAFNIFHWRVSLAEAWGISVAVRLSDGTVYTHAERIPEQGLKAEQERFSLRFSGGSMEGADGHYRIRLNLEAFSCDLQLRPILPPWMPGDSYAYLNRTKRAFSRLAVSSPWAVVSGSMVVFGRRIRADGQCYADRTLHNLPLSKLHSPTFAFHVFGAPDAASPEGWSLGVVSATPHPSYGLPPVQVLLLARGGRWLLAEADFSIQPAAFLGSDGLPSPYPSRFILHAARDGMTLSGQYYCREVFYEEDILGQAPSFVRAVGSLFLGRPVVYRIAGSFEGAVTLPDGTRIPLSLTGPGEYAVVK